MITDYSYKQRPAATARRQSAIASSAPSNACVLVVEDHEDTRFMLKTMLELRGGITVVEAEDGERAIALAESVHPDIVLIDGQLPLLDGLTATRRIRELISAPIVFISGHAQPDVKSKAFAAGCTDYLIKPFTLTALDLVLKRHLSPQ